MASRREQQSSTVTPLGHVVKTIRSAKRLTLDALSRTSTVSKRKIQEIEQSRPTRLSIMNLLADSLEVDASSLIFDIGKAVRILIDEIYVRQNFSWIEQHPDYFADDLKLLIHGDPQAIPFARTYHGRAGIFEFAEEFSRVVLKHDSDPLPQVHKVVVSEESGVVVVDLVNDLVRLRKNPSRTLCCKVKCTFRFENQKLVFFEDLFDTAAWQRFLSDTTDGHIGEPMP